MKVSELPWAGVRPTRLKSPTTVSRKARVMLRFVLSLIAALFGRIVIAMVSAFPV
jgi:hypothetical protein